MILVRADELEIIVNTREYAEEIKRFWKERNYISDKDIVEFIEIDMESLMLYEPKDEDDIYYHLVDETNKIDFMIDREEVIEDMTYKELLEKYDETEKLQRSGGYYQKEALRNIEWYVDEVQYFGWKKLEDLIEITPKTYAGAEDPDRYEDQIEVLNAIKKEIQTDKEGLGELSQMNEFINNRHEPDDKNALRSADFDRLVFIYTELHQPVVFCEGRFQGVYIQK
ncbi:hypothetical protein [Tetragenococcus halophilus]|uniref:hypothetical protein n=1 Tax=Tetragenococcus halophilus TaxID=51669 RepID=UPI00300FFB96